MRISAEDKRLWLWGGAVVAVVIVLLGWFLVIQPELSAAADSREQAANGRTQNTLLEGKNSRLREQNEDVATIRAGLAAALAALPYDSGLPEFTRQVSAQATENLMALTSVVVGNAQPVVAPPTDAGTSEQLAADPADATSLVAIPITLVATGTPSSQQAFLTAIQVTGPRRALVTAVQMAPASGDENPAADAPSTMTVQLTVFSHPLPAEAQAELEKLLSGP